jgi:hypothetical protein
MNTIGSRMKYFVDIAFEGKTRRFSEAMGTKNMYQYLNETIAPGAGILLRLWELGCDSTWLLTGTGEMYANNEQGQHLRVQEKNEEDYAGSKEAVQFDPKRDSNVGAVLDARDVLEMPVHRITNDDIQFLESFAEKLQGLESLTKKLRGLYAGS